MIISRSIHNAADGISFFLWLSSTPCVYACAPHLYPLSVDGHLGCFAIVNSVALDIGLHVSFQIRVFVFSGYMPRSGIAGSSGNYF